MLPPADARERGLRQPAIPWPFPAGFSWPVPSASCPVSAHPDPPKKTGIAWKSRWRKNLKRLFGKVLPGAGGSWEGMEILDGIPGIGIFPQDQMLGGVKEPPPPK